MKLLIFLLFLTSCSSVNLQKNCGKVTQFYDARINECKGN